MIDYFKGHIMFIKFPHLFTPLVFLLAILGQSTVLAGPLILTAPPRETPEKGVEIFQPIAKYLSNVLGEPVEYRYQTGWIKYRLYHYKFAASTLL